MQLSQNKAPKNNLAISVIRTNIFLDNYILIARIKKSLSEEQIKL